MTTTFAFLAPNGATGQTFVAKSGNQYVSDANGVFKAVAIGDIVDITNAGAISLGVVQAKSNYAATLPPTISNDNTQDYGVGSRWVIPTTGEEYICMNSATGAAVWVSTTGDAPAWVAAQYYGLPLGATLASVLTVLGSMYAYPIIVPNNVTLKSLNMSVGTGQTGGQVRCAIYSDNGSGYPGALLAGTDSGNLAATATAVVSKTGLTLAVPAGLYWVASQATASSTMPSIIGASSTYTGVLANQLGYDTAAHALATSGQAPTGLVVTGQTYGAMPASFPAAATLALNATTPVASLGL